MPASKASKKERERAEREIETLAKKAEEAREKEDYGKTVAIYQQMSRLAKSIRDKRAVDFCMDAARYSEKLRNDFKTGWCYKTAADHSLAFEDYNNAINFAEKAIKYFSRSNSLYVVQWCYNVIGKASEKLKDRDLAIKSYKKSLEIQHSEEIEDRLEHLIKNKEKDKKG